MEELKKLRRIVDRTAGRAQGGAARASTRRPARTGSCRREQFADAVDVTGIVLTKLDGTAKGGIVLAIQSELGLPVKVVGVGEGVERPRRRSTPPSSPPRCSTVDDAAVASTPVFDALSDRLDGIFSASATAAG